MNSLLQLLRAAKVYDLAQPYFTGMPHYPTHPPFLFGLTKQHGDAVGPAGNSSAADAIAMGSHVGTHIDALCHFSCGGKLHGGDDVGPLQSYGGGLRKFSVDTITPILRRGVLLDIAGLICSNAPGSGALAQDFEIKPEHLENAARSQGVEIRAGDVVLLRTGWAQYFEDARKFVRDAHGPGPSLAAAQWLSVRGIFAAGADTVAFEKVPAPAMPVHVHLLVDSGVHIIECLNLEELAADRAWEFVFVAAPMKIRGATGAPIRPLALVS
jgi:kynurenine formamidase